MSRAEKSARLELAFQLYWDGWHWVPSISDWSWIKTTWEVIAIWGAFKVVARFECRALYWRLRRGEVS